MSKVYVKDIPIKEYHADKSFTSSTGAKIAFSSMFKYLQYLREVDQDTEAKTFGRVYHTIMEGKNFSDFYAIRDESRRPEPDKTMGSKMNKEWKEVFAINAHANNLEICTMDDYEKAQAMKSVLALHKKKDAKTGVEFEVISSILEQAQAEISIYCEDYLGCKVKARPDISLPFMTLDFKSVADISPEAMSRAILKFGWDIQCALYSDLTAMYYDDLEEPPSMPLYPFYILAQEKKEPYDFVIYNISGFYYGGKAKLLKALDNIKTGVMHGLWGVIPQNTLGITLNPPAWAYKELGVNIPPEEQETVVSNDSEFDDDELIEEGGI